MMMRTETLGTIVGLLSGLQQRVMQAFLEAPAGLTVEQIAGLPGRRVTGTTCPSRPSSTARMGLGSAAIARSAAGSLATVARLATWQWAHELLDLGSVAGNETPGQMSDHLKQ